MIVSLFTANLKHALKSVKFLVPNHPRLPILKSVLLRRAGAQLEIVACDTEASIAVRVDCKWETDDDWQIAVNHKALLELVSKVKWDFVALDVLIDRLYVNDIQAMPLEAIEEYPKVQSNVQEHYGKAWVVNARKLAIGMRYVLPAVETGGSRPMLSNVHLLVDRPEDNTESPFSVVGTDGFRLHMWEYFAPKPTVLRQLLSIPQKYAAKVADLISKESTVTIGYEPKPDSLTPKDKHNVHLLRTLAISGQGWTYHLRYFSGEHHTIPDAYAILPERHNIEVTASVTALKSAIDMANTFATLNCVTMFGCAHGTYVLSTPEGGAPFVMRVEQTTSTREFDQPNWMWSGNADFLLDFLKAIPQDKQIKLQMNLVDDRMEDIAPHCMPSKDMVRRRANLVARSSTLGTSEESLFLVSPMGLPFELLALVRETIAGIEAKHNNSGTPDPTPTPTNETPSTPEKSAAPADDTTVHALASDSAQANYTALKAYKDRGECPFCAMRGKISPFAMHIQQGRPSTMYRKATFQNCTHSVRVPVIH